MNNILLINEMIDFIEDFTNNPSERQLIIGGMAGTQLFKYVMDCVLSKVDFENICIMEGCQDYMGLTDPSPCDNHFYYMDIIREMAIPDENTSFDWLLIWNDVKLTYKKDINMTLIGKYHYLIINDIHLMPIDLVEEICKQFPGKIIGICDPYEAGAERFIGYPNIVDTLTRVSNIVAFARSIYHVSSRGVEKKVKCSVTESKINRRSIGRIEDRQYVTNDKVLAEEIWNKQMLSPFRKGQRLWVTDERIHRFKDKDGHPYVITKNSLLIIDGIYMNSPKVKLRLFSSKFIFESEITYLSDGPLNAIHVRPANIIMLNEFPHHRYHNTALITNGEITPRERYTILKNTNNLTISEG